MILILGGTFLGGFLVFNHYKESDTNFNNADIIEVFATPTSSKTIALVVSSTPLAIITPTPKLTSKVTTSPTPSPNKTLQPSSSPSTGSTRTSSEPQPNSSPQATPTPSTAVSQPSQGSGGQAGSPASQPSTGSTRTSSESQPNSSPQATPTPDNSSLNVSNSKVLISEVQVSGQDAGDEFIELYNPTNANIDISGWSIQYLSGSTADITKTIKKNFEAGDMIPAHGFFLIARAKDSSGKDGYTGIVAPDLTHRSFSLSGASTGGKIFLVNNQIKIDNLEDSNISDLLDYSFLVPENGKSLERKYDDKFELNDSPSPQNLEWVGGI